MTVNSYKLSGKISNGSLFCQAGQGALILNMDIKTTQEAFEKRAKEHIAHFYDNNEGVNKSIVLEFVECSAEEKKLVMKHVTNHGEANPLGSIHGGITAWLLDTAIGMVNITYIGERATPTVSMSVNYIEPLFEGDEVIITSWIDRIGKTLIAVHAECRVGGIVKATAIGTSFRLPPEKAF